MKILFIGNSKTYRQNFPGIFKKLVEASGREVFVEKATKPGASLIELYQEPEVLDKIKSEKWDFVVIQERTIKALQDDISEFKQGATDICNEIINNNNKTKIIYNAVGVYDDYNVEEYDTNSKHYEQVAELTNGVVCYSGIAYINFHNKFPNIELFEDRHHPTLVGAFLSACCLYNVIYDKPSLEVKYYDVLNNELAVELQKIADEISIK